MRAIGRICVRIDVVVRSLKGGVFGLLFGEGIRRFYLIFDDNEFCLFVGSRISFV